MARYSYFPGCSLKGMGRGYEESLLPVMRALGVELQELPDWNCCGATAYMAVDEVQACVLASRNLALAKRAGEQALLAPCSACYLVLNKTQHQIQESPAIREVVRKALQAASLGSAEDVPVRHPLDVLVNDIGLDEVRKHVKRPLTGLKVAPYYGCQIVRPYATFDDQANPTTMDRLLEALGATVVRYPLKTKCCGGSLAGTLPEVGLRLAHVLLREALARGADVIATVCPLCVFNLDSYHPQIAARFGPARIPTVYFTQLTGLAFGLPARQLGLQRALLPMKLSALPALAAAPAAGP